jgi:hypothetical protein
MYTNGPATMISELPRLLIEGILRSNQWNSERRQPDDTGTTKCWSCTFPDNAQQDGTFTMRIGNKYLSRLRKYLEMVFAMSQLISW